MPATSLTRQAGAMIVPVALLALACGVHVASQRRRRFARASVHGPGAEQLALPAVIEIPAEPVAFAAAEPVVDVDVPRAGLPAVEHFEAIEAGRSALLRIRTARAADPSGAVLVVDRGDEMDLLTALPTAMADGALGFACDRLLLDGDPTFWLQLEGGTVALPAPATRTLR
jgi:hypothetical protein